MDPKRTVKGRFAQPNSRNLLLALFLSCSLSLGCADKVLAQELSDQEKIAQLEKVVLQQQTLIERLEKRLTVIESKEAEIAPTSTNSITPVNSSHPDSSSVAVNGRPTATASESTSPSQTAPSSPTAVPTTNVVTSKFPVQLYGMVKVDTIYDSSEVDNSNVMRLVKQERNSGPAFGGIHSLLYALDDAAPARKPINRRRYAFQIANQRRIVLSLKAGELLQCPIRAVRACF